MMLFTTWRNKEVDLIANASSFQEHFLLLKDAIDEQMNQYAVCSEELSQIQEQLDILKENKYELDLGQVAPNTEHTEIQDEAEGTLDLPTDFHEHYDFSNDVGIPSTSATCKPFILNEIADEDYREMVLMLNKEQKEFFLSYLTSHKNLRQTILLFPKWRSRYWKITPYKSTWSGCSKIPQLISWRWLSLSESYVASTHWESSF